MVMMMKMKMWRLVLSVELIFISLFISICTGSQASVPKRRCVYNVPKARNHESYRPLGRVNGSVQVCEESSCCVGYFWVRHGQQTVDLQACSVFEMSCPDVNCTPLPRYNLNKHFFKCVCNTDYCNSNISWSSEEEEEEEEEAVRSPDGTIRTIIAVLPVVLLLLMLCFLRAAKWGRSFCQHTKDSMSSSCDLIDHHQCSCHEPNPSTIDHAHIELHQVIGRGRFATVFQGKYDGCSVAVKCFPGEHEKEFRSEKEVYQLPLMKNAGIILFIGSGAKAQDNSFFIVMELAQHKKEEKEAGLLRIAQRFRKGSLHSFLSQHTVSWTSALNMCVSLSQGLSYLHSTLHHNGVHKPSVAHRDLSSVNVLLRSDLSCVLCDFEGSSVLCSCGDQQCGWSHTQRIQGGPLVGTLCYMSPELLLGEVNLSINSFLFPADVYSLALIMWEIWMRCSHLFPDADVPQHLLPYECEFGPKASLECLIHHVCSMNQRPSVPPHWDLLPQGCDVRTILTECWDADVEARRTSSNVVQFLLSLQSSSNT